MYMFSALEAIVARCPPCDSVDTLASSHVPPSFRTAYQCPFPPSATVHCTAVDCAKTVLLANAITADATNAFIFFIVDSSKRNPEQPRIGTATLHTRNTILDAPTISISLNP